MTLWNYSVEPTGAGNPSQNKSVEKWNDILAVTVWVSAALCTSCGMASQQEGTSKYHDDPIPSMARSEA